MFFNENVSIILQKLGGVIYDKLSDNYYGLDSVGVFICNKITQGLTIDEISSEISKTYDVNENMALSDTKEFIESLQKKGLLHYDE